jgi:glycosyltransferase involved in cell wall biosynthesis
LKNEIGIVIPTYNRKAYLREALDSILNQLMPAGWNFHTVIVDDGSTDGTFGELCELFGKPKFEGSEISLTPGLTLLRKANAERGAARNYGAQWLKTNRPVRWLMFFDADDVMCDQCLLRSIKRIEAAGDADFGAIYASLHIWESGMPKPGGESGEVAPEGDISEGVLSSHILPMGGTLIRADIFHRLNGFSENREMSGSEDWSLMCRIALNSNVIFSPHYSFNYRQHAENTPPQNYFRCIDLAAREIIPVAKARFPGQQDLIEKQILLQAALVKMGAVNSRGMWRDALKVFLSSIENDVRILLDRRAQRMSLSIAKRALTELKSTLL